MLIELSSCMADDQKGVWMLLSLTGALVRAAVRQLFGAGLLWGHAVAARGSFMQIARLR